jgi:hypothetical protein
MRDHFSDGFVGIGVPIGTDNFVRQCDKKMQMNLF